MNFNESRVSVLRGHSVLVAAPTGSGKTRAAELRWHLRDASSTTMRFTRRQLGHRLTRNTLNFATNTVVIKSDSTGDFNRNGDAPIVVMTTEVLRNMIYENSSRLEHLTYVVLDEVHHLGDRHRGAVWEEIILHLPKHVSLVGLSVMVSNAEELGDWMHAVRGDTEVVISEKASGAVVSRCVIRHCCRYL